MNTNQTSENLFSQEHLIPTSTISSITTQSSLTIYSTLTLIVVSYCGLFVSLLFIVLIAWLGGIPIVL